VTAVRLTQAKTLSKPPTMVGDRTCVRSPSGNCIDLLASPIASHGDADLADHADHSK
jgi:hypothetical protein